MDSKKIEEIKALIESATGAEYVSTDLVERISDIITEESSKSQYDEMQAALAELYESVARLEKELGIRS